MDNQKYIVEGTVIVNDIIIGRDKLTVSAVSKAQALSRARYALSRKYSVNVSRVRLVDTNTMLKVSANVQLSFNF